MKKKFAQIKALITEIAQREMLNNVGEDVWIYHFPNPNTIHFLAKLVYFSIPFSMTVLNRYGSSELNYGSGLTLQKKGKEWYLGNYHRNRKKHFSHFVHFFPSVLRHFPLYFSFGKHIILTEYTPKNGVYACVLSAIQRCNESFKYQYSLAFVSILSKFANTGIKLQIIVTDANGDFHVTTSRIWVRYCFPYEQLFFENTNANCRNPDFINRGFYLGMENKIVQIKYKNRILYSEPAFSEYEMVDRKNYIWRLMAKYQECL
ncbi:MAG: hypothetical protein MUE81_10850 [Thermoflexibacter sp.]|jgi:hypothetical protein|nr:hypothetical protein [Thermoflexibacter sp.]